MIKKLLIISLMIVSFAAYSNANEYKDNNFGKYIGPAIFGGIAGTIPVALFGPIIVPNENNKNDVVSDIEFPAVQFNQLIIPVFEHKI